jgi:hypothetical protein
MSTWPRLTWFTKHSRTILLRASINRKAIYILPTYHSSAVRHRHRLFAHAQQHTDSIQPHLTRARIESSSLGASLSHKSQCKRRTAFHPRVLRPLLRRRGMTGRTARRCTTTTMEDITARAQASRLLDMRRRRRPSQDIGPM